MPTTDFETSRAKRWWPRIAVVLGFLLAVLLLFKFGASVWLDHQRGKLGQEITRTTGYTTRIKGPVSVTLFPTPGFALVDVEFARDGKPVVAAKEFRSSFELLPLLAGKFIPHAVHIYGLDLRLQANAEGVPRLPAMALAAPAAPATGSGAKAQAPAMRYEFPDTVEIHNSNVTVVSAKGQELYFVRGLNLAVHPERNKAALGRGLAGDWKLAVYANFARAGIGPVAFGSSRLTARVEPRRADVRIESARLFDGRATGTVSWVDSGAKPQLSAKLAVSQFDAGQAIAAFQKQSFIGGRLNLQADLSSRGGTSEDLLRNATGTLKLNGTDLDLVTVNLDDLVARVIKSQQYNLVDAAAYFFLGPLGASVTKGLDVADVVKELGKGGTTSNRILRMISDWRMKDGIASATDVALETKRYRLALKGDVNLIKSEFNNVRIAVVDDRGCAIASQRLNGPIASPRVEKLNMVISVTQPVLDALSKTAKGVIGGNCDPFYRGQLLPKPVSTGAAAESTLPEGKKPEGTPSASD